MKDMNQLQKPYTIKLFVPDGDPKRHADVYIFCLHHEKGSINDITEEEQVEFKKSIDPLNTEN